MKAKEGGGGGANGEKVVEKSVLLSVRSRGDFVHHSYPRCRETTALGVGPLGERGLRQKGDVYMPYIRGGDTALSL